MNYATTNATLILWGEGVHELIPVKLYYFRGEVLWADAYLDNRERYNWLLPDPDLKEVVPLINSKDLARAKVPLLRIRETVSYVTSPTGEKIYTVYRKWDWFRLWEERGLRLETRRDEHVGRIIRLREEQRIRQEIQRLRQEREDLLLEHQDRIRCSEVLGFYKGCSVFPVENDGGEYIFYQEKVFAEIRKDGLIVLSDCPELGFYKAQDLPKKNVENSQDLPKKNVENSKDYYIRLLVLVALTLVLGLGLGLFLRPVLRGLNQTQQEWRIK